MDVLANLVASFVLAALVTLSLALFAYLKFYGGIPWARRRLFPNFPVDRVFCEPLPDSAGYVVMDETPFVNPLTPSDIADVVAFYAFVNKARVHDGRVIRLDAINPRIQFPVVGFFDLITTNLTAYPDNLPVQGVFRRLSVLRRWLSIRPVLQSVHARVVERRGKPSCLVDVLENPYLANAVAVSALIVDSANRALVVRRSSSVAVASGQFGATCSGTLAEEDVLSDNPFRSAVMRELLEETGISNVRLEKAQLLVPKQKMQPVVAYFGRLEGSWTDCVTQIAHAVDRHEAEDFYILDIEDSHRVSHFMRTSLCSDTLAWQIWTLASWTHTAAAMRQTWRSSWVSSLATNWRRSVEVLDVPHL